ncbi:transglutaminase-like domain-containing protein [Xylophilus ampelinus]|uniref:Transglutaminase-like putative cysteine protease n=1 Tax=Xylophilus ampelinus TaxID=54067 RepID=A0A318SPA9_9BURK|nr:transglutaminase family protein [Xylophilus ampelinus]MCS4511851.1 transglutaminase family protein [Xylophilus ampelinus]PYE73346.1 transglutaminase-like putative cysteine protease [Xylophilus ampelinus]
MSAQPLPAAALATTVLRCELEYQVYQPSHFIFQIECARSDDQLLLAEQLTVTPGVVVRPSTDPADNRTFRCDMVPGLLNLRYDAAVRINRPAPTGLELEAEISEIPEAVLPYLMPSRFCPSDTMGSDARYLFGHLNRGPSRVDAICRWIRDNIAYQIGTSNPTTTALDAYQQRAGVCRDFAHLAITFCRALNIPARLVGGYCHFDEPPQDFHAVIEAWIGSRWIMFDPTRLAEPSNIVRVATGLDAKNTAFATVYGAFQMTYMHIQVSHEGLAPLDNPDPVQATVRRQLMAN